MGNKPLTLKQVDSQTEAFILSKRFELKPNDKQAAYASCGRMIPVASSGQHPRMARFASNIRMMASTTVSSQPDQPNPEIKVIPLVATEGQPDQMRAKVILSSAKQKQQLFTGDKLQNLRQQIEYAFNMRLLDKERKKEDKKLDEDVSEKVLGLQKKDEHDDPWVVDLAQQIVKAHRPSVQEKAKEDGVEG